MFRHHFSIGRALRLTSILLCLLLILTACAGSSDHEETPSDTETEPSTRFPEAETDSSALSSYEALIIQLQQTLLDERENHYISEAEYRARLEQLEAELRALKEAQSVSKPQDSETTANTNNPSNDASNDIPTGTIPNTGSENSFSFSYSIENGTATILEYLGGATSVAIPSTVNGYPITAIADNAFKNSAITSVTIPSTVTEIGWFAFYGCVSLSSVTIPDSVTVIRYAAFDACPKLTILCSQNSYAARFVDSFGLRCEFI